MVHYVIKLTPTQLRDFTAGDLIATLDNLATQSNFQRPIIFNSVIKQSYKMIKQLLHKMKLIISILNLPFASLYLVLSLHILLLGKMKGSKSKPLQVN